MPLAHSFNPSDDHCPSRLQASTAPQPSIVSIEPAPKPSITRDTAIKLACSPESMSSASLPNPARTQKL
ncbi:hypothetical protein TorRG33x02_288120 [Trema orientale]|uniref:Uncharacterized protein n=1 Tax=Trema orientale TaxID=63057 RepID=A0A2P5CEJ6_TREOI|nr:hypothetical protein TorRG33x02_288120 [Trema orientale]